jgi:hypothetical protein
MQKIAPLLRALLVVSGFLTALAFGSAKEPIRLTEHRDELEFLRADHWIEGSVAGQQCLILDVPGEQRPPVRRPGEYALWKGKGPAGGTFTVQAATLMPAEVKNRDVCIIFGYQDDTHFYYAHVSSNSDGKVHNVIMRVDGDSRERINHKKLPPVRLKEGWNDIRIQHLEDGSISVWVNDMEEPMMTASDQIYPRGRIGFGAFDDRAAFASLQFD